MSTAYRKIPRVNLCQDSTQFHRKTPIYVDTFKVSLFRFSLVFFGYSVIVGTFRIGLRLFNTNTFLQFLLRTFDPKGNGSSSVDCLAICHT